MLVNYKQCYYLALWYHMINYGNFLNVEFLNLMGQKVINFEKQRSCMTVVLAAGQITVVCWSHNFLKYLTQKKHISCFEGFAMEMYI